MKPYMSMTEFLGNWGVAVKNGLLVLAEPLARSDPRVSEPLREAGGDVNVSASGVSITSADFAERERYQWENRPTKGAYENTRR
jgi:hypothetical protein